MLLDLTRLVYEVDRTRLKKICKEILVISASNPFEEVSSYFYVLCCWVECGELDLAAQLLELIEGLSEPQRELYARLIR